METEEKKTPNQNVDATIDTSFKFTNEGIVIETYGIYPQFTANPKERELRINKVKKMRKAHSKILNVLNRSGLTYKEIKKIFDLISKEANSILNNSKVTFKVQNEKRR